MSLLRLDRLAVGWPGQPPVLTGLELEIPPGARVGLVGPNGAGKSCLLHTIAGALPPCAGTVRFRDRPVRPGVFQPQVALVFQQAEDQLFCPTLAEDVAFGARALGLPAGEVETRVAEAIATCALGGLETRPVHRLSGGEKRRAALAGALVMRPELLLLDEPSAALDLRNRRQLIGLLARMDQAMLIASHDLEMLLELCPRVVLIDGGRIIADGPARALMADHDLMTAHGQEVPHSLTGPCRPGQGHRARGQKLSRT